MRSCDVKIQTSMRLPLEGDDVLDHVLRFMHCKDLKIVSTAGFNCCLIVLVYLFYLLQHFNWVRIFRSVHMCTFAQ